METHPPVQPIPKTSFFGQQLNTKCATIANFTLRDYVK